MIAKFRVANIDVRGRKPKETEWSVWRIYHPHETHPDAHVASVQMQGNGYARVEFTNRKWGVRWLRYRPEHHLKLDLERGACALRAFHSALVTELELFVTRGDA